MTFIYDILVNLNYELFDFYDWDEKDNFSHIRKTPLFKVNSNNISDFIFKKVKVDEEFLISIKDKTQMFSGRNVEVINYACIISDGNVAVMLEFDQEGYSKRKSKFLVNEEFEILDLVKSIKNTNIVYNVVNSNYKKINMIRSDKNILDSILDELFLIKEDNEKIDYLYYEWFDTDKGNNKYDELVHDLKKGFTSKHLEMKKLINLLTVKK